MELLAEYGLFLAKVVTMVFALVVVLGIIAAQKHNGKLQNLLGGSIRIKKINKQFEQFEKNLKEAVLSQKQYKIEQQQKKKEEKQLKKQDISRPRIYFLDFNGDVEASQVENIRHEVTAILTIATKADEVVVNIESMGGMVHTYGLAASQLQRIRDAGIPLTVCIDKVAASGGYLMACVADKILAAPFAIIGSIGVLAQIPNFHRALKKYDVDYEIMTAGEYKAPITMFGEITDKGRNKLKEDLENTHELFKAFISEHRPQVVMQEVATGEVWYGKQAIDNQLIDGLTTSDDYFMQHHKQKDIFLVSFAEKKSLQEKLGLAVQHGVTGSMKALLKREQELSLTKI